MTDRERLIAILSKPIYPREGADKAEVVADYLLENGVRPVVMCKDCKYAASKWADINGNVGIMCGKFRAEWWDKRQDTDFCSYGERRTDGTEID